MGNQMEKPVIRVQPRLVKNKFVDSMPCTYVVSVVAASIAELATYPLDLTKTRLQIQGEAATVVSKEMKYRGMLATAYGIAREEGILKLWQGIPPALYRHVVYSGMRVCTYDFMRRKMLEQQSGTERTLPLWKSAVCGVSAGVLAQWCASPTDLVKVQLQMEGKRRLMGHEPRVRGTAHAFKEILRRGGITGLWKGSIPNMQRAALVNLGDLTAYDVSKQMLMSKLDWPDCPTVHLLASTCAGFVAAVLGTPADVIKTRVMNQPTDEMGRGLLYTGSVDCLKKTITHEGISAIYKGFLPLWIRLGPWALTFWVSFEQIRVLIGASGY